jgi:hypothetical protein
VEVEVEVGMVYLALQVVLAEEQHQIHRQSQREHLDKDLMEDKEQIIHQILMIILVHLEVVVQEVVAVQVLQVVGQPHPQP